MLLKQLCKSGGSILLSAVTVKGQAFRPAALLIGVLKSSCDQIGAGIAGNAVAYNFAGVKVKNSERRSES